MSITLELAPEEEVRLEAQAKERGMTVNDYLRYLITTTAARQSVRALESLQERRQLIAEICGKYQHVPTSVDQFIARKREDLELEENR